MLVSVILFLSWWVDSVFAQAVQLSHKRPVRSGLQDNQRIQEVCVPIFCWRKELGVWPCRWTRSTTADVGMGGLGV